MLGISLKTLHNKLNLYRDRPGPLSDDEHADALVMADVAAQAVLVMQANAPPGRLAAITARLAALERPGATLPTTCPALLMSGPPELPGLIGAVVCKRSL